MWLLVATNYAVSTLTLFTKPTQAKCESAAFSSTNLEEKEKRDACTKGEGAKLLEGGERTADLEEEEESASSPSAEMPTGRWGERGVGGEEEEGIERRWRRDGVEEAKGGEGMDGGFGTYIVACGEYVLCRAALSRFAGRGRQVWVWSATGCGLVASYAHCFALPAFAFPCAASIVAFVGPDGCTCLGSGFVRPCTAGSVFFTLCPVELRCWAYGYTCAQLSGHSLLLHVQLIRPVICIQYFILHVIMRDHVVISS